MIRVSRLNRTEFFVNAHLIQSVESNPDTLILLSNGEKLLVRESAEEVVDRVVRYRRSLADRPHLRHHPLPEESRV